LTFNTKSDGPLADSDFRSFIIHGLSEAKPEASPIPQAATNCPALKLSTIPPYDRDARFIEARLAMLGIPLELQLVTPEQFKGDSRLHSDMLFFSLIRDQDEQLRLFDLFKSISEHLAAHDCLDIEQALKRITKETDSKERTRLLKQIEQKLAQDHLLWILDERPVRTAFHSTVRGVSFNAQGWVDLRKLWFRG